MHLVPTDQAHRRVIDEAKVCEAIAALEDPEAIRGWAQRFSLVGDPTRLRLLLCIEAAGPVSVSDLAVATGLSDDHVSQSLRFMRASRAVETERDGRVIRYRLCDQIIADLVATCRP